MRMAISPRFAAKTLENCSGTLIPSIVIQAEQEEDGLNP
jgi:hypothetical protein